jgi:lipopolysaccharide transport system ATP-binding protein
VEGTSRVRADGLRRTTVPLPYDPGGCDAMTTIPTQPGETKASGAGASGLVAAAPLGRVTGTPTSAAGAAPDAASEPVVVRASDLTKDFRIYKAPTDRLVEWGSGGRIKRHTLFRAVDGVSFELRRGHCLGVVGANGAGKSTLLKMLTGVLRPTAGTFGIQGRVLSLLELSAGLDTDMTGRENVGSMATLLNFPRAFALERTEEIEAFAELGEFFDRPVRLYSSGMRARLGFAMYACFRPDVFIVDEVLSVGDVFFRQKCATRMRELLNEGMTMMFVSHDAQAVLNLCDEAILLQKGRVVFSGAPEEAIRRHHSSLSAPNRWPKRVAPALAKLATESIGKEARAIIRNDVIGSRAEHRHGTGEARIVACRVTDASNKDVSSIHQDGKLTFHVLIESDRPVARPSVGIQLYDRLNNLVFASATAQLHHKLAALEPGRQVVVFLTLTLSVMQGPYTFGLTIAEPSVAGEANATFLDCVDQLGPIEVSEPKSRQGQFFGIARLPLGAHHIVVAESIGESAQASGAGTPTSTGTTGHGNG